MSRKASRIFSSEDARRLAQQRLPRLIFDFVDGAAGREIGASRNQTRFDEIQLQPRVMADVARRDLTTSLLGETFEVPFGVAPMGMCNLARPNADRAICDAARDFGFPVCSSSAASSSMKQMRDWAGNRAWFQLYFGHSTEKSLELTARALDAGYQTLVLTVDVPQVARRVRDLRNGFRMPFRLSPHAFMDFATHPRWSLTTLAAGIPSPKNFSEDGNGGFDRSASRTGANWDFLAELRRRWPARLIVKGVTSKDDARQAQRLGVDAIYVSNHGARQLDSAPASIDVLPIIRHAVGPEFPLLFDSGIRGGEDVIKAFALGADFVMLGRPILYALAAEGSSGLRALLRSFVDDISIALAQIGVRKIEDVGTDAVFMTRPLESSAGSLERIQLAAKG